MDLAGERVEYKGAKSSPALKLRACGATDEECAFLVWREGGQWVGDRVELNAMRSDQFIAWLEGKLTDAGVQKVIPDRPTLEKAYRRAVQHRRAQEAIDEALASIDENEEIPIPGNLDARIQEILDGSAKAWDQVLWDLVTDEDLDEDDLEDSEVNGRPD
jgi:hypothetical protein